MEYVYNRTYDDKTRLCFIPSLETFPKIIREEDNGAEIWEFRWFWYFEQHFCVPIILQKLLLFMMNLCEEKEERSRRIVRNS